MSQQPIGKIPGKCFFSKWYYVYNKRFTKNDSIPTGTILCSDIDRVQTRNLFKTGGISQRLVLSFPARPV